MKHIIYSSIVVPVALFSYNVLAQQTCNDGLETNSFVGWQGKTGHVVGGNTQTPNWTGNTITLPNHYIVSSGKDTCGFNDIPFPAPGFGNYSAGIGQPQAVGCVAEQLEYSFVVTPADTNFLFTYAIVMQDGGHTLQDQPVFRIELLDQNSNAIPNGSFLYVSGPNVPGFLTANCGGLGAQYKKWTLRGINLSNYIGQSVTLRITNSDCGACGHFSHGYVDFDCDGYLFSPRYCPGGSVTLNAHSEPGSTYLWEDGSAAETLTINSPTAGDTISCWVTLSNGYTFPVNYILTPAQVNFAYAVNGDTVSFANLSDGAISCLWDFGDGNFSSSCNPSHVYSAPGTYTVCLTIQTDGCNGITGCSIINVLSTGIKENSMNGFSISPNPTSSKILIQHRIKELDRPISISIINLMGIEVMKHVLSTNNEKSEIDVSSLSSGVYFVQLKIGADKYTKKLILSK